MMNLVEQYYYYCCFGYSGSANDLEVSVSWLEKFED